MKTVFVILACAVSYFAVSAGINFITGDAVTAKSLVKGAVSALVFSIIFVPILMKSSKKKF